MEIKLPSMAELRERFTLRNAPGWLLQALGIFTLVVWILNAKGTIEEAMSTAGQVSHVVRIVLPLLLSPWFGLTLIIAGVLYVIFVPQKHHLAKNVWIAGSIAWTACILSILALWSVFLVAITVNRPPYLTEWQKSKLKTVLGAGPDISSRLWILSYPYCFRCRNYAWKFANTMDEIPEPLNGITRLES